MLLPGNLEGLSPLIREGTLTGLVGAALRPSLVLTSFFTSSGAPREFPGHQGQTLGVTREGTTEPDDQPAVSGQEPTPSQSRAELYYVAPSQYHELISMSTLVNLLAIERRQEMEVSTFARDRVAKKLDFVARRKAFVPYCAGRTRATGAGVGVTALPVASINGFTTVMTDNGVPVNVSATNPLYVSVAGVINQVTAATPANAAYPLGPGTLTLAAVATFNPADPVLSHQAPKVTYAGASSVASVDAISAADILDMDAIDQAVTNLRMDSVPTFEDGFFHAFITPMQERQLRKDPKFASATVGRGQNDEGLTMPIVAELNGVRFFSTPYVPGFGNMMHAAIPTVGNGVYSDTIGGEVRNAANVRIERCMVFGRECGELHYIDTSKLGGSQMTIASPVGGGSLSIGDNAIRIFPMPWVRMLIGGAGDVHQLKFQLSMLAILDMVCPTDYFGGNTANANIATTPNAMHKRAHIVHHAA